MAAGTVGSYHEQRGPWNRECACGKTFASGRGTINHIHAQRRKKRAENALTREGLAHA